MVDEPRYKHEARAFWKYHLDAWKSTTLTQTEYCRMHKLSKSSFSRWKYRLKGQKSGKGGNGSTKLISEPMYSFYCSYCGKRADEVRALYPRAGVSICIDCVEQVEDIYRLLYFDKDSPQYCIFCKVKPVSHALYHQLKIPMCESCLEKCNEAVLNKGVTYKCVFCGRHKKDVKHLISDGKKRYAMSALIFVLVFLMRVQKVKLS